MIERLRNWFTGLSRREQWLVGAAGALTAFVLLVFGIILPGMATIDRAAVEHDEAVQRRGRIEATVEAALSRKPAVPGGTVTDIELVVTQAAAEEGFDIVKSPSATPGQVSFRIDQARSPALLAWLSRLEAQGAGVRTITLRGAPNGGVIVDAQLQQVAQ
ncbi:MAG TPA: type II secretion system protein GspM [Sphingorhabdus sp.]|jgi:general secretion pathway protein M|nr:type II secretion system protein GspM [Sphingorhabdus sp.]